MKKSILIIVLIAATSVTFAGFINKFTSWDNLIERSSDIIIAKCTATLGTAKTEKPTAIIDGIIPSDIEVVSVLKGGTKPGPSHLFSQFWPSQGEQFLVFGNFSNNQFYTGYDAGEFYQIIPLNPFFRVKELAGKKLDEQIKAILKSRLNDLNDEMKRDGEEKARIEKELDGQGSVDISSNVPPGTPDVSPRTGGGTSF